MTARAHWARYSNNFGDVITPVLLRHFGIDAEWTGRGATGKLLAVGTLMDRLRPGDVVWGAGAIPLKTGGLYTPSPDVRFLAVRGPKTRSLIAADVPEVYGDPGVLLPRVFPCQLEPKYLVGVIPHEVEKDIPRVVDPSVLWIDINAGVESVVRAVCSCEVVLSSSLHGIIAAEAYGVPALRVVMSSRINGGSWKFDDYRLSTGREPQPVLPWEGSVPSFDALIQPPPPLTSIGDALVAALLAWKGTA